MRLELLIDGMIAVHAKHAIFAALAGVADIARAEVELGRVELDTTRTADALSALEAELRAVIEAAGYSLREVRVLPRQLPTL